MSDPVRRFPGMDDLTDTDRAVLAFAKRRYRLEGRRDADIRAELDLSPTAYFAALVRLLDSPAAALAEPQLVARLRRGRDRQMQLRNPRRVA